MNAEIVFIAHYHFLLWYKYGIVTSLKVEAFVLWRWNCLLHHSLEVCSVPWSFLSLCLSTSVCLSLFAPLVLWSLACNHFIAWWHTVKTFCIYSKVSKASGKIETRYVCRDGGHHQGRKVARTLWSHIYMIRTNIPESQSLAKQKPGEIERYLFTSNIKVYGIFWSTISKKTKKLQHQQTYQSKNQFGHYSSCTNFHFNKTKG